MVLWFKGSQSSIKLFHGLQNPDVIDCNMKNLTSDNEFSGIIFVCWRAVKFMSESRSQLVAKGRAKVLKIGQQIKFLWPK